MCVHVCMCGYEGTPSPSLSLSNLFVCLLTTTVVIMAILITIIVTSNSLLR